MAEEPVNLVPRPDPTLLTTAQLYREIAALSATFDVKNTALNDRLTTSQRSSEVALEKAAENIKDGLDKAEKRTKERFEAITLSTHEKVVHLRELTEGNFKSIESQFALRDRAAEQLDVARQTAIAAALQAQKEAAAATNDFMTSIIAKSEANFTKLIDSIAALIASNTTSIVSTIDDLKGRMDRGEGHGKGLSDGWGYIVGAAGVIGVIVMAVLT